jgi:hypothetical protein
MPTKRRTRHRSLKPHVTDEAVWVFLLLEEIINNSDDAEFEPRGRRREALDIFHVRFTPKSGHVRCN